MTRLALPWNESFETVRKGQRIGRGPAKSPDAGRWSTIAAATFLVLVVLLLVPLAVIGTLGPTLWSTSVPKFANTKEKARVASIMRPFVLPKDPRITPLDAGRAFYNLHTYNQGKSSESFPENPVPDQLPPAPWSTPLPPDLFPTDQSLNLPSNLKVIAVVRAGVTPTQLSHLQRIASAPQWKHWDLLSRARSMDYIGARFRMPFGDNENAWALPIPRYGETKMLAYASVSRAAYHLSRGRRDSAEAVLRGTVSVGFLLADEGNTLIEALIGIVITSIARQGLIDYYKAIGDPRGPALQARLDSVVAHVDAATQREAPSFLTGVDIRDAAAMRTAIMQIASDRNEPRAIRFAMMNSLGVAPCTNLREVVFGPNAELRALFDRQRAALGRFASDTALIDLMERDSETLKPSELWVGKRNRIVEGASLAAGALLRNKRLPGCVALLLAFN